MATKRKAAKRPAAARKAKRPATRSIRQATSLATSSRQDVASRLSALAEMPMTGEDDAHLRAVLAVVVNTSEPIAVRLAALQTLQTASFSSAAFPAFRGDYIAALRTLTQDPDPELRQRVLGFLAREKDGFAQKKLLEGLRDPAKALVPPEKALQLLSYDVHAEAYPIARAIVSKPPNPTARREALRLLAADAKAAPMFERLLRDKDETREIRQISAAALQATKPDTLQKHAREILLDPSEQDEIQATCLTALTQFGNTEAVAGDTTLMKRIERLRGKASSNVKRSARQFLTKYGR